MVCHECSIECKKHGKDRQGQQRYRCKACGKTFLEDTPKPLGSMRIELEHAVFALKLLLEGMSIRATERMTGLHRDTLCDLVVTVGRNCKSFLKEKMQKVPVENVECDEIWGFVGCKEKTRQLLGQSPDRGDAYCFVAMERTTKVVITWHLGKRTPHDTADFIEDLRESTAGRYQLSTDGWIPYYSSIPHIFRGNVDFAQVVKKFGKTDDKNPGRRYSPATIIGVDKMRGCGSPDMSMVCTSHIERLNLSIRMGVRRMTRLTNAHSKKWGNHEAMLALFFAWYNFCKKHTSLKATPAQAQGLTDHQWTIEELLNNAARG